jgi:D-inositol-3-phosphate glycosyltransferase
MNASNADRRQPLVSPSTARPVDTAPLAVALLTGGSDKPYALGLASALAAQGVRIDFVGSDELDCPQVHAIQDLRFLNLRGDQSEQVGFARKASRILAYYGRLVRFAATSNTPILHILWNNKFELLDRTVLMAFYRLAGKRIVFTAHNVNTAARDGKDTWINSVSLRVQYRLAHHVFVHTERMKRELMSEFDVPEHKASVIPFGINNTIPTSDLTAAEAKRRFGLDPGDRTLLFFGQIAPYKGLEYLIDAVALLSGRGENVRLIIGGKIKRGNADYWTKIQQAIEAHGIGDRVIQRIQFIPDEEVEPYFKAADAVVIPYVSVFQSGVPFLAFSFGVPVIATDVGSLRDDITEDTGMLCRSMDPEDLAQTIASFFRSELHTNRESRRVRIRQLATEAHSWTTVAERTRAVYAALTTHVGATTVPTAADVKCPE